MSHRLTKLKDRFSSTDNGQGLQRLESSKRGTGWLNAGRRSELYKNLSCIYLWATWSELKNICMCSRSVLEAENRSKVKQPTLKAFRKAAPSGGRLLRRQWKAVGVDLLSSSLLSPLVPRVGDQPVRITCQMFGTIPRDTDGLMPSSWHGSQWMKEVDEL